LRSALTSYLESVQPNFKVGMLFSGKKTEEERQKRKQDVAERLGLTVSSQITNHLKKLMKSSLKDAGILTDTESLAIDDMVFEVPFSVVEEQTPKGASTTGDAVLNFANSISTAVQRWFIRETDGWKKAQEEKFKGLTDDANTEIDMKSQILSRKILAIETLEEMDSKIEKVKKSYSAMLPK